MKRAEVMEELFAGDAAQSAVGATRPQLELGVGKRSGYVLQGLALLIETKECKRCKQCFRFPSNVMLKLYHPQTRTSIYVNPKVDIWDLDLPRETKEIHIPLSSCEACFAMKVTKKTPSDYELFGQHLSKKQLEELRIKIHDAQEQRSNFWKAPKAKKPEKPIPKIEELF